MNLIWLTLVKNKVHTWFINSKSLALIQTVTSDSKRHLLAFYLKKEEIHVPAVLAPRTHWIGGRVGPRLSLPVTILTELSWLHKQLNNKFMCQKKESPADSVQPALKSNMV
jgi:hypothetical protein